MSYQKPKKLYSYTFPNVDALITYVETHQTRYYGDDAMTKDKTFTGTANWQEAVKLYQEGWPEGLSNMVKAMANAAPVYVKSPSYYMDVAGAYPIVPLAVAGDPANMYNPMEEELKTKPVVRLMVNRAALAVYSAKEITNYGAAVLSYVAALEQIGVRIELWVCAYCEATGGSDYHYNIEICVKKADEIMELDKLAFALVHPSMLRRFVFGHRQRAADLPANSMSNCGRSCTLPPMEHTLTIAGIGALAHNGDKMLQSPVTIAKALEPMIKQQLEQLGAPSPSMVWDNE